MHKRKKEKQTRNSAQIVNELNSQRLVIISVRTYKVIKWIF